MMAGDMLSIGGFADPDATIRLAEPGSQGAFEFTVTGQLVWASIDDAATADSPEGTVNITISATLFKQLMCRA